MNRNRTQASSKIDELAREVTRLIQERAVSKWPKPIKFRDVENVLSSVTTSSFLPIATRYARERRERLHEKEILHERFRDLIQMVKQVRYDQQTLETKREWAMKVLTRMRNWGATQSSESLEKLIEQASEVARQLTSLEERIVSQLPPEKQRSKYARSSWPRLLEPDHSLASTREKLEDQRFRRQLDRAIQKVLGSSESAIVRYAIISAFFQALGVGRPEPTAIKQSLYQKRKEIPRKNFRPRR